MTDRSSGSDSDPEEVVLPPIASAPLASTPRTRAGRTPSYVRRHEPDPSPWALIGLGAVLSLAGTGVLQIPGWLMTVIGAVMLVLGSVLVGIGTIAEGIRLGARWVDFDRGA
jgi:hypothetical protein